MWLQIYGLPTVRRDIQAPKKQSIANDQNYGSEPNSRQLINPAASSERGISQQQLQQQLSPDALRYVPMPCKACMNTQQHIEYAAAYVHMSTWVTGDVQDFERDSVLMSRVITADLYGKIRLD